MPRRPVTPNLCLAALCAWWVALMVGGFASGRAHAAEEVSPAIHLSSTHGPSLSLPDEGTEPPAVIEATRLVKPEGDAETPEPQTWAPPALPGRSPPIAASAHHARSTRLQPEPAGLVTPSSRRIVSAGARAPPRA